MRNRKYMVGICLLVLLMTSACSSISLFSPTATPLPTPTPQPTNTPTPVPLTQLTQGADGAWVFFDLETGYQFEFNSTWYLEDVSHQSLEQIFALTKTLKESLNISSAPQYVLQPDDMRVLGLYLDETIADYMSATFSVGHIESEDYQSMPIEDITSTIIAVMSDYYGKDPSEMESKNGINENGVKFGGVVYSLAESFNHFRLFFKVDDGIVMIVFGFSEDNLEILGPDLSALISSLKYTNP